jgi:hypothetical protein
VLQTVRYDNSGSMPKSAKKSTADEEESSVDIYPLMLRVSVMQEINMTIKISKKVSFFFLTYFFIPFMWI